MDSAVLFLIIVFVCTDDSMSYSSTGDDCEENNSTARGGHSFSSVLGFLHKLLSAAFALFSLWLLFAGHSPTTSHPPIRGTIFSLAKQTTRIFSCDCTSCYSVCIICVRGCHDPVSLLLPLTCICVICMETVC